MEKELLNYEGLGRFLSNLKTWIINLGYTTNTGTITGVKTTAGKHSTIDDTSGVASFNVPTKTSHLTNDSDFAVDASYVHTDNNFTNTLKSKLDGVETGAEVNIVKSIDDTETNGINLSLNSAGKLDITVSTGSITSESTKVVTGGTVYSTTSTLAPKSSPTFTGTPKAPNPELGTNDETIATTKFVNDTIANSLTGRATFVGAVENDSEITTTNYSKGQHWLVAKAGTYVGQSCEIGDVIYCTKNKGNSYNTLDFTVLLNNLDIAIITEELIDELFLDNSGS